MDKKLRHRSEWSQKKREKPVKKIEEGQAEIGKVEEEKKRRGRRSRRESG